MGDNMAQIIDFETRKRTDEPEPSHRDSEFILNDFDWWELVEMFYENEVSRD
jgi:hypothetical protein